MQSHDHELEQVFRKLREDVDVDFLGGERIVIAEVSEDYFQFAVLQFSKWRNGFNPPYAELGLPDWAAVYDSSDNDHELKSKLQRFLESENCPREQGTYTRGYLLGSLAKRGGARDALLAYFSVAFQSFDGANQMHLPRQPDVLAHFLRRNPLTAPCSLTLCLTTLVFDGENPELRIMEYPIFQYGERIPNNKMIREVEFRTPAVDQPFLLILREKDEQGKFLRDKVLELSSDRLSNHIAFFGDDLDGYSFRFRNNPNREHVQILDMRVHDQPLSPPQIDIDETYHTLAIVIESTLGIYAVDEEKRSGEGVENPILSQLTPFKNVHALYTRVLEGVQWSNSVRYLTVFYGDDHDAPYHLIDKGAAKNPIVFFPPHPTHPTFVTHDHLTAVLDEGVFLRQQTYSADWHKSAEIAAALLTRAEWGSGEKIVLWIGQCPPHLEESAEEDPLSIPTYRSQISFWQMHEALTQQGVHHIALFVKNDLDTLFKTNTSNGMYDQAQAHWNRVGGARCRAINLADVTSSSFEDTAKWVSTQIHVLTNSLQTRGEVRHAYPQGTAQDYYWALLSATDLEHYTFLVPIG